MQQNIASTHQSTDSNPQLNIDFRYSTKNNNIRSGYRSAIYQSGKGPEDLHRTEYVKLYNKWDNLRARLKRMKIDNIDVSSYKDVHIQHVEQEQKKPITNNFGIFIDKKVYRNHKSSKVSPFRRRQKQSKSGSKNKTVNVACYKALHNIQPSNAVKVRQRMIQSTYSIKKDIISLRNKTKDINCQSKNLRNSNQLQHSFMNRRNPEMITSSPSYKKSHPSKSVISNTCNVSHRTLPASSTTHSLLLPEQDLVNRVVIRRKSLIKSISHIYAYQVSIVREEMLLFICESVHEQINSQLRLILSNFQCREMMRNMGITLCELGSVLLDYVKEENGKLKINRSQLSSYAWLKQFRANKDAILSAMERSQVCKQSKNIIK